MRILWLFLCCGLAPLADAQPGTLPVGPSGNGVLVTTNQFVTPAGVQVNLVGHPLALAIRPDHKTAAVLNTAGAALNVINLSTGAIIQQYTGSGVSFDGVVYSAGGNTLYSSGDTGGVTVSNVAADGTLSFAAEIDIPQPNGFVNPGGLALSADGTKLYVVLNRSNALGIIDLAFNQFTGQIPVGNAPHSVAVVGNLAYVTNEGGRSATPQDFTNLSSGTPIVASPTSGGAVTGTVTVVDLAAQASVATHHGRAASHRRHRQ